jgi:hypothetical protein
MIQGDGGGMVMNDCNVFLHQTGREGGQENARTEDRENHPSRACTGGILNAEQG